MQSDSTNFCSGHTPCLVKGMKSIKTKRDVRLDMQTSAAGEEDPGAAVDAPAAPGPAAYVSRTPSSPGSVPAQTDEEQLQLPHELDQNLDMTGGKTQPIIQQAAMDLDRGLVDTDMRATPGLDAQQRAHDVPGPGGEPAEDRAASRRPLSRKP